MATVTLAEPNSRSPLADTFPVAYCIVAHPVMTLLLADANVLAV